MATPNRRTAPSPRLRQRNGSGMVPQLDDRTTPRPVVSRLPRFRPWQLDPPRRRRPASVPGRPDPSSLVRAIRSQACAISLLVNSPGPSGTHGRSEKGLWASSPRNGRSWNAPRSWNRPLRRMRSRERAHGTTFSLPRNLILINGPGPCAGKAVLSVTSSAARGSLESVLSIWTLSKSLDPIEMPVVPASRPWEECGHVGDECSSLYLYPWRILRDAAAGLINSRECTACGVHAHCIEYGRLAGTVPPGEKSDPAEPSNGEVLDSKETSDRQVLQTQPVVRHAGTSAVASSRGARRWRVACSKA